MEGASGCGGTKAFKRGRLVPILAAGASAIWSAAGTSPPCAAPTIFPPPRWSRLRFPQEWAQAVASEHVGGAYPLATTRRRHCSVPVPMVPPARRSRPRHPQADEQATLQTADLDAIAAGSASCDRGTSAVKAGPVAARCREDRQRTTLNQHQQPRHAASPTGRVTCSTTRRSPASKTRLHLTPDQEQMWPAVEAALRNMAYTHAQQARGAQCSGNHAQAAAVDPERGARPQIGGRSADHEFQRRTKRRSAQPRPRHGTGSARVAILIGDPS